MKQFSVKDPLYFVGIGGTGMAPLAEHCLARGMHVKGSDVSLNLATKMLAEKGAEIFATHNASQLGTAQTLIYSSAIQSHNVEWQEAKKSNLTIMHRSDMLAALMQDKTAITVAGTHGKTTTTALITHMLTHLGQDPSAVVGGRMLEFDSYARIGKSNLFIAEADESDGTLVKYKPYIAVLNNIEGDHLDHHGDMEGLNKVFANYLNQTDSEGMMVIGWDNPAARNLALSIDKPRLSYGSVIGADVRLVSYAIDEQNIILDAVVERDRIRTRVPLLGKHNAQNALCALAVARALEFDIKDAAATLGSFKGVARRLSLVYDENDIRIYDDYAHNPGKLSACITSVKEAFPTKQLLVAFQPHRYSRLHTLFNEFAASFTDADQVFVCPVYAAGESKMEAYTADRIAKAITSQSSVLATPTNSLDDCVNQILKILKKDVIILTVGAGDVWQVGYQIKEGLDAPQNKKSKETFPKL